ncbi:MAG: hypothetical protein KGR98_01490 [Verrucomicrobia bacterium]|nr:hypothetical protein [Verrucomicrobiota bacterium]MDE3099419.1 hypothetical protein [Verrucomicrobiota bacterium]
MENDEREDGRPFRSLGRFQVVDARRILKAFETANIRFELRADNSRLRGMDPFTAMWGGYWGRGSTIEIAVHPDDEEQAGSLLVQALKILT